MSNNFLAENPFGSSHRPSVVIQPPTPADVRDPVKLLRVLEDQARVIADLQTRLAAAERREFPAPEQIAAAITRGGEAAPLNVTALRGVLAEPQRAAAPKFDTLPPASMSYPGQLARNSAGALYVFDEDSRAWSAV